MNSHRSFFSTAHGCYSLLVLLLGGCGYSPHPSSQGLDAGTIGPTGGAGGGSSAPDALVLTNGDARGSASAGTAGFPSATSKTAGSGGMAGTPGGTIAVMGGQGGAAGAPGGTQASTNVPDAGVGGSTTKDAAVFLDVGRDVAKDAPPSCVPACAGKCGGDDGCGSTCPNTCRAPQTCGGGGTKYVCGCKIDCYGKCGGDDLCGGLCPDTCVAPQTCGGGGVVNVCGCKPNCTGKCAGDDGCGNPCPNLCSAPQTCEGGGRAGLCGSPPPCAGATGTAEWVMLTKGTPWPKQTAGCPFVLDTARNRFVIFTSDGKVWDWDPVNNIWTDRTPSETTTRPTPRWFHGMAYDSGRKRMVMFGGRDYSQDTVFSDTWEWDGLAGTWARQEPGVVPPPTEAPGLVYDRLSARTIMLPMTLSTSQSVWEWDGSQWTEQKVTGPRWGSWLGMVWDSDRNKALGFSFMTTGVDTPPGIWEWQHGKSEWTRVAVGCATFKERNSPALLYVPGRKQVLFYGGVIPGLASGMGDLWTWSVGALTWQQFSPTQSPPGIYNGSLVYEPQRGTLILLAGRNQTGNLDEVWQLML